MNKENDATVELTQRVNPFCVISKAAYGECPAHDIQSNTAWWENPYGDGYAVVPDEMVPDIIATTGFCDIILNEDETEVVGFTAREIPDFSDYVPQPTLEERVLHLEEAVANGGGSTTGTEVWDEMAAAIEEGVNEV